MDIQRNIHLVLKELETTLSDISAGETTAFADAILNAERIFVAGAGRTGLVVRAFAMRLMQFGLTVFVVGDTTTPAIRAADLLVIGSGSGATASLIGMAEKAKAIGASVALVTIFPQSRIGALSDVVVEIPAPAPKASGSHRTSIQPMGSLFEQSLLMFLDLVILELMTRIAKSSDAMFQLHANLE